MHLFDKGEAFGSLTCRTRVNFHHDSVDLGVGKIEDFVEVAKTFPFQFLHVHQALGNLLVIFALVESGMWHNKPEIYFLAAS